MPALAKALKFLSPDRKASSFVRIRLPVDGRLYVSPMPYGPYDVRNQLMRTYVRNRVSYALVLVTDEEIRQKCKKRLFRRYEKAGIVPLHLPVRDMLNPLFEEVNAIMPRLLRVLSNSSMVIHCNAGVGRTAIVTACCVAVIQRCSGDRAIATIRQQMQLRMTTSQKTFVRRWVEEHAEQFHNPNLAPLRS